MFPEAGNLNSATSNPPASSSYSKTVKIATAAVITFIAITAIVLFTSGLLGHFEIIQTFSPIVSNYFLAFGVGVIGVDGLLAIILVSIILLKRSTISQKKEKEEDISQNTSIIPPKDKIVATPSTPSEKEIEAFPDIQKLIDEGLVEKEDEEGNTPLHRALKAGQLQFAKRLIVEGSASLIHKNKADETPIHFGLKSYPFCYHDSLSLLVMVPREALGALDKDGHTILYLCIRKYPGELKALFAHLSLSIDFQDETGSTCLHLAIRNKNYTLAAALLREGASPCIPNLKGERGCDSAIKNCEDRSFLLNILTASAKEVDAAGNTLLHIAARWDNSLAVQLLLDGGLKSDQKNLAGETPMHLAFKHGSFKAIPKLIDLLLPFANSVDNEGNTFLHALAQIPPAFPLPLTIESWIDQLISFGIKPETTNNNRFTARELIKENQKLREAFDKRITPKIDPYAILQVAQKDLKITPLLYFLQQPQKSQEKYSDDYLRLKGSSEKIPSNFLLYLVDNTASAKINQTNGEGKTALQLVAQHRYQRWSIILRKLLEKGASIKSGATEATVFHWLLKGKFDTTTPHIDAFYSMVDAAKEERLLNMQNGEGNTLLHYVTHHGLAKKLLEAGASLGIKNKQEETPLDVILKNKKPDKQLISLFVEYGDDEQLKKPTVSKVILGHYLLMNHLVDIKILVKKQGFRSTINHPQENNSSLLHWAAEKKEYQIAKVLNQYGASKDAQNSDRRTPIHLMIKHWDNNEAVETLDSIFPDTLIRMWKDRNGHTLLHLAASYGNKTIARFLLGKGRSYSAGFEHLYDKRSNSGSTPMHLSLQKGTEIFEIIVSFAKSNNEDFSRYVDNEGNTLFHAVAVMAAGSANLLARKKELIKKLVEMGINPDKPNIVGTTARTLLEGFSDLLPPKSQPKPNPAPKPHPPPKSEPKHYKSAGEPKRTYHGSPDDIFYEELLRDFLRRAASHGHTPFGGRGASAGDPFAPFFGGSGGFGGFDPGAYARAQAQAEAAERAKAAAERAAAFKTLGLPQTATEDEIRKAYLRGAKLHHPDKFGHDPAEAAKHEEKFKEISNAQDLLLEKKEWKGEKQAPPKRDL